MIPYTYMIKWTGRGMSYYGVRYSQRSCPEDLWVSYFTSSKRVSEYRAEHGEPDVVQVRRVFATAEAARRWECALLRRIKAPSRSDFLNCHDAGPAFMGGSTRGRTYDQIYGPERAEELREKRRACLRSRGPMRRKTKLVWTPETHPTWGKGHTLETKRRISEGRTGSKNPRYDHAIYRFRHDEHGVFEGTRGEMVARFPDQKLHTGCLRQLIDGENRQHRGWVFVGAAA